MLARYTAALLSVPQPKIVSFAYDVEQVGPHDLDQSHRIYRSGGLERDEILAADGYRLKIPSVRILGDRVDHFAIARVAPSPAAYGLIFTGALNEYDGYGYGFAALARQPGSFAVTHMEVDGRSFLPRTLDFASAANGVRAKGTLRYARFDHYWLVVAADVDARMPDGKRAHERIRFSDYRFPTSLPSSTFLSPRAAPATPPSATTLTAP